MKEKCDKCKSDIFQGECKCGTWYENDNSPASKVFENAILAYDHLYDQKRVMGPLSMDHHSGNCMIIFKGDYDMCIKARDFITELHKKGVKT